MMMMMREVVALVWGQFMGDTRCNQHLATHKIREEEKVGGEREKVQA